jgi:hypothetical protein
MKIKLLVSMAIAAAVGSNAFALEISKGKLISHKEWSTGGAIASSQPGSKTLESVMRRHKSMLKSENSVSYYFLEAETAPATGRVGEPVSVSNNAFVYARNDTSETQTYNYNFSICTNKSDHIIECVYAGDVIELLPGGFFSNTAQPVLTVKFDKPGSYSTMADSIVYVNNVKSSFSTSIADITLT